MALSSDAKEWKRMVICLLAQFTGADRKWSEVGEIPTLSRNCKEEISDHLLSQVASFPIGVSDLGGRSGL